MTTKTIELTNTEDVKEILLPDNQINIKIENVDVTKDTHFDIGVYLEYNIDETGTDETIKFRDIYRTNKKDQELINLSKVIPFSEEKMSNNTIYIKSEFKSDGKANDLEEATKDLSYSVLVSYTLY